MSQAHCGCGIPISGEAKPALCIWCIMEQRREKGAEVVAPAAATPQTTSVPATASTAAPMQRTSASATNSEEDQAVARIAAMGNGAPPAATPASATTEEDRAAQRIADVANGLRPSTGAPTGLDQEETAAVARMQAIVEQDARDEASLRAKKALAS
jgi:hypothetical protein